MKKPLRDSLPRMALVLVVGCSANNNSGAPGGIPEGNPSCSQEFVACGGNLNGTWVFSTSCPRARTSSGCTTSTTRTSESGTTFAFSSDGTYTIGPGTSPTITTDVSSRECFSIPGGFRGTCAERADVDSRRRCVEAANGDCVCTTTPTAPTDTGLRITGTWSASGGTLTVNPPAGTPGSAIELRYCVQGSTLVLASEGSSSPAREVYRRR